MIRFIEVVQSLKKNQNFQLEVDLIYNYLNELSEKERIYAIRLFMGKRSSRICTIQDLKKWSLEFAGIPEWLYNESREVIGEISETIHLIIPLPKTADRATPTLEKFQTLLNSFQNLNWELKKGKVNNVWKWISPEARRLFNKLVTNTFRFKCNESALIQAIARQTGLDSFTVAHQLRLDCSPESITYKELFQSRISKQIQLKPCTFCQLVPLQNSIEDLGIPSDWYADWYWKGERCQLIKDKHSVTLWSENQQLLNHKFQQIEILEKWTEDTFVLDGMLIRIPDDSRFIKNSNLSVPKNQGEKKEDFKITLFCAFDILSSSRLDCLKLPLAKRREELESFLIALNQIIPDLITLSEAIQFESWQQLGEIRSHLPFKKTKGIVLRKKSGFFENTTLSDWMFWPSIPFSIKGVLLYVHRGTGMGSKKIHEYTFGVRTNNEEFLPISRTPIDLNVQELEEIEAYILTNTIERFGPVLSVIPSLVFEITFQELNINNRRKSGLSINGINSVKWLQKESIDQVTFLSELRKQLDE